MLASRLPRPKHFNECYPRRTDRGSLSLPAALLSGGALFGFTSPPPTAADCPLKGTPDCPLVQNCAQAGTPACTAGALGCCAAM
ncbi:hypothetical protein GCM10023186_35300 [Hymenobacter koreensis]|uniref:WAP domain-containing protein n=1 Tax=Hymenobacter koreensis TaxID=1084523 RepID=A0ABP8JCB5_9BACT